MRFKEFIDLPVLTEMIITRDGRDVEVLQEGKWISSYA